MNAKKSFSNAHEKAFEKDLFISFFNRELQSKELIDQLVEHGIFRFGEQIFQRFVVGDEIPQHGRKRFQQGRTRRFLGEADDCFFPMEENLDVSDGGCFQKIDGELENGDIVLVFRHLSDGGGGEALSVLGQVKIIGGAVCRKGDRDGFDRGIERRLHDLSQQSEGYLFDAARKVGVQERKRDGKNAGVFTVDTEGAIGDGHERGTFLHFFLSGLRLRQSKSGIQGAQHAVCVSGRAQFVGRMKMISEVLIDKSGQLSRGEKFRAAAVNADRHADIGQNEKILSEHTVELVRALSGAHPNVIAVAVLIHRVGCIDLFFRHFLDPFGGDQPFSLPNAAVKEELTEFHRIL